MKTYTENRSGNVLVRKKETHPMGRYTYSLHSKRSSATIGTIYFEINRVASELAVFRISVSGHTNAATAQNPHPGVGRLLMYMACKHAAKQGIRTIRLTSEPSATGFYRQMGLRHPQARVPQFSGEQSTDGRLQAEWLNTFGRHLAQDRRGGMMVSELATVLHNIEFRTLEQWEEGRTTLSSCIVS